MQRDHKLNCGHNSQFGLYALRNSKDLMLSSRSIGHLANSLFIGPSTQPIVGKESSLDSPQTQL